jgi:hypothetical protein
MPTHRLDHPLLRPKITVARLSAMDYTPSYNKVAPYNLDDALVELWIHLSPPRPVRMGSTTRHHNTNFCFAKYRDLIEGDCDFISFSHLQPLEHEKYEEQHLKSRLLCTSRTLFCRASRRCHGRGKKNYRKISLLPCFHNFTVLQKARPFVVLRIGGHMSMNKNTTKHQKNKRRSVYTQQN